MTSESSQVDRPTLDAEEDRRRRHADAQKRYRDKNLEKTRTKARLLTCLVSLRSARELSEEATRLAAEQRRIVDADYRERSRKQKFIDKFGQCAFIEYYLPLHHVFGNHLPGRQFVWSDEVDKKRRRSRKAKSKSKVAVGTKDHLS
ncbi:hypothetical protein B0H13DRAFT_2364657 [Mycena leptocephala]|nr:hypothetical protein B0H13DRAFT_2364657 [Mycena leptocephala]